MWGDTETSATWGCFVFHRTRGKKDFLWIHLSVLFTLFPFPFIALFWCWGLNTNFIHSRYLHILNSSFTFWRNLLYRPDLILRPSIWLHFLIASQNLLRGTEISNTAKVWPKCRGFYRKNILASHCNHHPSWSFEQISSFHQLAGGLRCQGIRLKCFCSKETNPKSIWLVKSLEKLFRGWMYPEPDITMATLPSGPYHILEV